MSTQEPDLFSKQNAPPWERSFEQSHNVSNTIELKDRTMRRGPERLRKKQILFQIISREPEITVVELRSRAALLKIELSISSAYRVLAEFEKHKTVEQSDVRCLRIVSTILQETPKGQHVSAKEIQDQALKHELKLHKSTTYRVLERLRAVGLVSVMRSGKQNFYEWRSEQEDPHGHLTCINCGKTIEFPQDDLDEYAQNVCERTGYEFVHMEFLIRSVCISCRT